MLWYKPVRMLVNKVSGRLARAVFKKIWKAAAREDETPKPTDARRGWREVLVAAALEGMIFAVVKAVADRGTAEGARKLTGVWPGENANGKRGADDAKGGASDAQAPEPPAGRADRAPGARGATAP